MQTFAINTLGCKVNQYESQQIIQFLTDCKLLYVQRFESAEIIIIHTCCVTKTASAKSRQLVNKAQKLNPNAKIIVSGCLLNSEPKEFESLKDKALFASNINELFELLKKELNLSNPLPIKGLQKFCGQTRAFLKVQDGCDGYCSYCIIPTTRPNITFKPVEQIITETQDLVKSGHKEIILTGIFLGAYGQNTVKRKNWPDNENPLLAEMLEEVAQVPDLKRIRLSSLEPADVTSRLLEVMKNYPNIMPHLHLSLQSGSDKILKKMNRQYTVKDFLNSIENINLQLDRPAITTDVIVGFPGETMQDFAQSLSIAKLAGFSKIHIFPFSKRVGTAAEKLQDQTSKEVITERTKQLHELEKQLAQNFRKQFIGQTVQVLIEDEVKNCGKCERYYEIIVKTDATLPKGEIVKCIINSDAVTATIEV
ncbi:MAG: tRNA (N(6)-L-threonylcarbamoyladenosine(37)-C(2))-methylthiotransferase MtaB [Planctomycetes bacterium GWF2_41_51]|nr:MAG: tRNA (N(6)-L-threonylcarbamoyladenosine(37)-C(2))-methylthiotransferase MtaB [Planctomycetes bacterium GWF2_41_51]HBG28677.1 tRNA (N(6)-L-threonylcarbamoyladenosine(37)-C(2))-methylthiotransferase MtaB [Phycisphaerales bacterium]